MIIGFALTFFSLKSLSCAIDKVKQQCDSVDFKSHITAKITADTVKICLISLSSSSYSTSFAMKDTDIHKCLCDENTHTVYQWQCY